MRSLDELDYQIIAELETDARISILDLSRKLGYPNSTIRDRVHKLEEEQIILGYTTRLNYERLGFGIKAVILVARESVVLLESALQDVAQVSEVTHVQYVTGEVDEILTVHARNIDHLKDIIFNKFSSLSGSSRFNTLVVLQENTFPFSPNLFSGVEGMPEEGQ
jgi:Lrp/AsnC family transcriptional regulator, regulator for asnA, asnC and gidA